MPYPVNYGGVIDLFWKLPALHRQGIKIHLHCFDYGKGEQKELNKYCYSVNYYKRSNPLLSLLSGRPYMVASRNNKQLFQVLLKDDYPILSEGIHTTALLTNKRFNNRKIFVRLHNIEHQYYEHLHASSRHFLKKIFYRHEAKALKKYEAIVAQKATAIFAVTIHDSVMFQQIFNNKQSQYLPLFLPDYWQINSKEGNGNYCLYHGDLSIDVNVHPAIWLLQNVVAELQHIPFVFAGKNPLSQVQLIVKNYKNVRLISNPDNKAMGELIANAQINVLPSFSTAGIKLKLLNALYNGRFCIANKQTLHGSNVNQLCIEANTADEFIRLIEQYFTQPFVIDLINKRQNVLNNLYNNNANALLLDRWIFG